MSPGATRNNSSLTRSQGAENCTHTPDTENVVCIRRFDYALKEEENKIFRTMALLNYSALSL